MKKIKYIAFAAAALAAVSCAKNVDFNNDSTLDQGLTLKFYSGEMVTKADVDGVNNENLIKRIDYFFFPLNAEGEVDDATEYVYKNSLTPTDGGLKGSYSTVVEPGVLSQIFPDGATKAMVFAIANYVDKFGANNDMTGEEDAPLPNTDLPEDAKTWKDLHDLEVGATFFYDDKDPDFQLRWPHVLPTDDKNLFFVMSGEQVVELKTTGSYSVDAEVPLKRLASKVTVDFTYEDYLEKKFDKTGKVREIINWVPQETAGETRVFLSNAIEHTTIGGPLTRDYVEDSWGTATKPLGNGTRDIFEYAYNFMNDVPVIGGKKTAHFYTYPINSAEGDDNQPYLKLVLPWYGYKYFGTAENPTYSADDPDWKLYKQKEVYYKIVLPRETIKDPNCIYEYSVNVNIIGSDKEVKVIGNQYVVKDWLSDEPISAKVNTGLYISLEIPKEEYDMYVDKIDINYVSSGTVVAHVDEIYQLNYSSASGVTRDYFMQDGEVPESAKQGTYLEPSLLDRKGIDEEDVEGWVTIPANTSHLEINHPMDNRMTINGAQNSAFDMAPYIFEVTLHLVEAGEVTSFDRHVTITQYPSMFVKNKYSLGYAFINGYDNQRDTEYDYWGRELPSRKCYDDRGESYSFHLGNFGYQTNTLRGTGSNDNPNNYIITVSILPDVAILPNNEKSIIGDPRDPEVNNLTDLGGLTNYHPSLRVGTKTIIAPKFIVASSYSALSSGSGENNYAVDLEKAEKRCASYQENGYPAGRWRVPTASEIMFMAKLSKFGFIPSLFNFTNTSAGYWSANGKINGSGSGDPLLDEDDTTSSGGIRCVYDAWYWGEEPYQENATSWLGFQDK